MRDDDVDTVRPGLDEIETLDGEVEPLVGVRLQVGPQGQPLLALAGRQQPANITSCKSRHMSTRQGFTFSLNRMNVNG